MARATGASQQVSRAERSLLARVVRADLQAWLGLSRDSNMAHRPKGTAFKPEDPERKNRHTEATALPRNASGNIYGQVSNMDGKGKKDRATAQRLAKQKNKSLLVPGNTDRIMQQATKPKVLYASSVAGMGRIPKKSNVSGELATDRGGLRACRHALTLTRGRPLSALLD